MGERRWKERKREHGWRMENEEGDGWVKEEKKKRIVW